MRRIWPSPEKPKRPRDSKHTPLTPASASSTRPARTPDAPPDARRVQLVLKLGGSALTRKASPHTLHDARFHAAADCVARLYDAGLGFIVVHGAGSFGHFEARKHAVVAGHATPLGMSATHAAVRKLNALLVDALVARGVPAVGVAPLLVPNKVRNDFVAALLDRGHLPVLHGDACYAGDGRTAIISGDALMVSLVSDFEHVTRAVFLSDVPGVLRSAPEKNSEGEFEVHDTTEDLIRRITINEAGELCIHGDVQTTTADHDVTGGMSGKVLAAGRCASETRGRVVAFIAGVGTDAAENALMGRLAEIWSPLECTRIGYEVQGVGGVGGVGNADLTTVSSGAWPRKRWFP